MNMYKLFLEERFKTEYAFFFFFEWLKFKNSEFV